MSYNLGHPPSKSEFQFEFWLLCFQFSFLLMCLGKEWEMILVLRSLNPHERLGRSFWLQSGFCNGVNQGIKDLSFSCLSSSFFKTCNLQKKTWIVIFGQYQPLTLKQLPIPPYPMVGSCHVCQEELHKASRGQSGQQGGTFQTLVLQAGPPGWFTVSTARGVAFVRAHPQGYKPFSLQWKQVPEATFIILLFPL